MERFLSEPEAASAFQWYGWSDARRRRRQWSEDRLLGDDRSHLMVRYLFTHTLVMRIEADTESGNIAEQRALEKAGFTREGILRGDLP